jgi:hypothetical protein
MKVILDEVLDAVDNSLPPQMAIVAFSGLSNSVCILMATPELSLDIVNQFLDDDEVFNHDNTKNGIWVWEGTIIPNNRKYRYTYHYSHAEYYPGTWRRPSEAEWARLRDETDR